MSLNLAAAPDAEMEQRWRACQIQGLEGIDSELRS
jgi:hypothetical protein